MGEVKKEFPAVKVIAISTFSYRGYTTRMIDNGASGYLIKSASAEEIKEAIHTVINGRLYLSLSKELLLLHSSAAAPGMIPVLTRREKEIAGLIAEGLTNNQSVLNFMIRAFIPGYLKLGIAGATICTYFTQVS